MSGARPLRILHVCSIKGRGGTGYMAGHLCRLLHASGETVTVGGCAGSKVVERARSSGIPVLEGLRLRRGFRPYALWRDVLRLRRFIRRHNIEIVHTWHSIEYWTCALAVRGTRAKLARTRGLVTPVRAHLFNRCLHARTAALFVTCEKIRNNYLDAGFSEANIHLLRDGVDTVRFRPGNDPAPVRQEAKIPTGAFVVACVARLERVKGQGVLMQALPKLPGVHALFAGGGSREQELKAVATALGLADRAHFLGVRDDVPRVLAAADAYALCSIDSEGSSRATLEAMAAGLPCVTSDVGMLPDIVVPEETGFLIPPSDNQALAYYLSRLQREESLRRRLAENARAMVQEKHSEAAMLASVANVYRRIADG